MRAVNDSLRGLDFILITDRKAHEVTPVHMIRQAIEGGVGTVQLREKELSTRDLYNLAREIREITEKKSVKLIINDRIDIAMAVNADGVHLGWQSLNAVTARRLIGRDKWIGFSAHSVEEAEGAEKSGVDYITLSPIFNTLNKKSFIRPLGPEAIGKIKQRVNIPVIALGGINESNVNEVLESGADGIAVISAILLSKSPEQTAASIYGEIKRKFNI